MLKNHKPARASFRAACFLLAASAAISCKSDEQSDVPAPRTIPYSPALAEMLYALELDDHVVAINDYARQVPDRDVPRVGDYNPNVELVLSTRPDLILIQQQPEAFAPVVQADEDIQVEHFSIERLADIPAAVRRIGGLMDAEDRADQAAEGFKAQLASLQGRAARTRPVRAMFVMGTDLPAVAGDETFLGEMIDLAGGVNVGEQIPGQTPWRNTRLELIIKAAPEVLIVKAGQAEADQARQWWMQWTDIPAVANRRVHVVTDDRWVRPGLHLAALAQRLYIMLHETTRPQQ